MNHISNETGKIDKPLQILLAEDEPVLRELTEALLVQRGHEVVAVGDSLAALKHGLIGNSTSCCHVELMRNAHNPRARK